MAGYSSTELDDIQARWNLQFPPDLVSLLRARRVLLDEPGTFDWIRSEPAEIERRLNWPLEGFWFDVENSAVWWPEWGAKPDEKSARRARLKEVFADVPRLIPLYGHRYIPQTPAEAGNPIFSVHQTDIIHYGANLEDWIARERAGLERRPWPMLKEIPFWSEAVRRSGG